MNQAAVNAATKTDVQAGPRGTLDLLSQVEVRALTSTARETQLLDLFRRCALAVLTTAIESDDADVIFDEHADFAIGVARRTRGVKLIIKNAPATAFVNGRMIEGVRQHLFSVLRDIVYTGADRELFDLQSSEGITNAVFHILKNARVLKPDLTPKTVICWGGHAISRKEYEYTKEVGYHLGLLGVTEPGIIAAEPPNPMVSDLVILPDIEKRLETFLRIGHGVLVFPGSVATAEEILYLLGVLLAPANAVQNLPVIFTGPADSADYFVELDAFLRMTLGDNVAERYEIVIGDAPEVGNRMGQYVRKVRRQRRRDGDAYYFNWLCNIPLAHQQPFEVSHENVAALHLGRDLPAHELVVNLRRAFSEIVTGNVKDYGTRMIARNGPFEIHSDSRLIGALEHLLPRAA